MSLKIRILQQCYNNTIPLSDIPHRPWLTDTLHFYCITPPCLLNHNFLKTGTRSSSVSVTQVWDTYDSAAVPLERKRNKDALAIILGKPVDGRWKGWSFNDTCTPAVERELTITDMYTDLLVDHFKVGNKKDYVLLKHIRKILKENGYIQKDETIVSLVKDVFSGVEFKERSTVGNKRIRNYFLGLTRV